MVVGAAPVRLHPGGGGQADGEAVGEAHVRVVDRCRGHAVGVGRRVPDRADPRRVDVAGAVDHGAVGRDHGAHVAGRVADVDHGGRGFVDAHVAHVVQRRTRRDGVDRCRHRGGDAPRPGEIGRGEPYAGRHRVVGGAGADQRHRGIDHVAQRRARDCGVLRWPVEAGREARPVLKRHGGGLRDRIGDQRLLRLRRAGHGGQHRARHRCRRDAREVGRQRVGGDEAPRPVQRRCAEPAPRHQHVVGVVAGLDEQVGRGVGEAHSSCVPLMGTKSGWPRKTISSVGA